MPEPDSDDVPDRCHLVRVVIHLNFELCYILPVPRNFSLAMLPNHGGTFANSPSQLAQASLSCATSSQRCPIRVANAFSSSSHRVAGLPCARSPAHGNQCKNRLVHLSSVRLAMCPAQRHLRLLCSCTQSRTFPFCMMKSTKPVVLFHVTDTDP